MARAHRVLTRRRVILLPSQKDSANTTSSIANNDRTFRLLLHDVARVTQSTDFQTACSEAAHGNRRMPFCALLPCYQTPPSPLRSISPKSRRRFRAAHSRVGQPGSAVRNREETLHQDGDDGSHPGSRPIRQSFGDEAAANDKTAKDQPLQLATWPPSERAKTMPSCHGRGLVFSPFAAHRAWQFLGCLSIPMYPAHKHVIKAPSQRASPRNRWSSSTHSV